MFNGLYLQRKICYNPHVDNKEKYAFVVFNKGGYKYIYKLDCGCRKKDVVIAPTNNYESSSEALVVKIKSIKDTKLPYEKSKILTINQVIGHGYKFFTRNTDHIRFMKKYIDNSLLQEWGKKYKTNWVKIFYSTFGGEVSYEKDGVLSLSFGDMTTDDYFFEYAITSPKHLRLKINFAKTILSKFYYKQINKKEFSVLLGKIN